MTDLRHTFPQTANQKMRIQARTGFWITVGEGVFPEISEKAVDFAGKGKVLTFEFDVNIRIELVDATNCVITINGNPQKGTYKTEGETLVIVVLGGPKPGNVRMTPGDKGTYFDPDLQGLPGIGIWIGP